jgi:hypothetical protein
MRCLMVVPAPVMRPRATSQQTYDEATCISCWAYIGERGWKDFTSRLSTGAKA